VRNPRSTRSTTERSGPCALANRAGYTPRGAARRAGRAGTPAPDAAGTPAHRSPRQPTCRRERPARIKNESPVCSGEKSLRPARAEPGPDPGLGDFGGLADRAGDRVRPPPPLAAPSRRDERPGCRLRPRGALRHGQWRGATAARPHRARGQQAQVEPEARAWIDAHFPREEQEPL
jgi:hypothetical protein